MIDMQLIGDAAVWGIHAGRTGDADTLFRDGGVVALGWDQMGDLSGLAASRDAYKTRYIEAYPDAKPGAVPGSAGQMFRFVNEMQIGDVVIYPSKADKKVNIGIVTGDYFFDSTPNSKYPQRRTVEWRTGVPRTTFSQGALYEIGSALSLFQVKNYADEFLAALDGYEPKEDESGPDETVALVAEEIQMTTQDFVIKQLSKELKGVPFEEFVADVFGALGYKTRVTQASGDKGVDVIAHRDELGIEPPIIKIQVKSTQGTVGDPEVSQLFGKVAEGEFGVLVTLGRFSKQARDFADSKANLRLVDGDELVRLVLEHYEALDPRHKGIIPLRQVYIPEGIGSFAT